MKLLVFTLSLMAWIQSDAGVNLKNGNFYISYTDIRIPSGSKDLKVSRTYNSKSTADGWFGFGWGSEFETYLEISADGSVIVHENGSGATTRFVPKKAIDPGKAADSIIAAIRKDRPLSGKAAQSLRAKLMRDEEFRRAYSRRHNVSSSLKPGTILTSNNRGLQKIKKTRKGFTRLFSSGKKEFFNALGKLVKSLDKDGYAITFNYKGRVLKSIKDSQGKQLHFSWYSEGKVKEVWSSPKQKASFRYRGKSLVWAKDVAGNVYVYGYDNNYNMTSIEYEDGTKMTMTYESKTFFISKIVDKDGTATDYKYESNPKDPLNHYWTLVTKTTASGRKVTNKFEYEIKAKADGEKYTYRLATEINGVNTETIYSECCSLPVRITRGSVVTNFEYNGNGLLTRKYSSTGEKVQIEYKGRKIVKVVNNRGWTKFTYNKKAALKTAVNSAGDFISLSYNLDGRIKQMIEKNKKRKRARTLRFNYNGQGRPNVIEMVKVGKISVEYSNSGEIKRVKSKSGRKLASQITRAFQSLLAVVRPAGVNLNI